MQFCQKLVSLLKFKPTKTNVHIKIGHNEFDFLVNSTFIEYHPWDFDRTDRQYYIDRRKILDVNGYKNNQLIVVNNLQDFNKVAELSQNEENRFEKS